MSRRQVRLARARRWATGTTLAIAVGMVGAASVGIAPWWGVACIPVAALGGYLRRLPNDLSIAQRLDERLRSRDLLASGVACLGREDDASRSVVAQANALASRIGRPPSDPGPSRAELAAGLSLGIALVLVVTLPGGPARQEVATPLGDNRSGNRVNERLASRTDPPESAPGGAARGDGSEPDSSSPGAPGSDAPSGRSRDATGEGMASTPARTGAPLVGRSSSGSAGSSDGVADAGAGRGAERSSTADSTLGTRTALRGPLPVDATALPDDGARERARSAMDADQVDYRYRDLVRAYFDLDEPK